MPVASEITKVNNSALRLTETSSTRGMLLALMLVSAGTPHNAISIPSDPPVKLRSTLSVSN